MQPCSPVAWPREVGRAPDAVTSPALMLFDLVTRLFSPYEFNPFNYSPLRQVLIETVDFDALHSSRCPVKLFLSATNVRTGRIKVFPNDEIGPDAVLASACLPLLFQAVEIGGEHYWDGGYMGNPPIFPLICGFCPFATASSAGAAGGKHADAVAFVNQLLDRGVRC